MRIVLSVFAVLAFFSASGLALQPEGRFERTLKVSGPVELDLATDSGGIVVSPGPAGSVQVRAIPCG